jgi:Pregnancy-associated plasma protein-A/Secretion system C-terminal sorting domain
MTQSPQEALMNRSSFVLLAVLALALTGSVCRAFADQPSIDVGDRWATPENLRHSDAGDVVYRCGTDASGPKIQIPKEQIDRWIQENRIVAGGVIPVYFHVIYSGSEGYVPDSQLDAQIQVMNYNYAGRDYNGNIVPGAANTGYSFVKAGTDHTNNRKWFRMTPGSGAERQAKNALAINPGGALNIWTCKPGQNLLGWSVFPWGSQAGTSQDGVVIHYGSVPGGYLSPYNLGGTATHEVGHYLGLYHTFQGGCDGGNCNGAGDLICDTESEGTSTSGCPSGKDTCPEAGLDPIHNYMDYSTDICYTNFTPGQDTRMNQIVTAYRPWIGATRVANADAATSGDPSWGKGKADDGETVYRCATKAKKVHPFISKEQVDRWIAENRLVANGVIPVHFHVIYTAKEGNVSDADIAAQIQVLNYNYGGLDYNGNPVPGATNTGYSFTLASVDRTKNNKWFRMAPGSTSEIQAKNALSINPAGSLNIYTCKPGQNLLGWAYFPQDAAGDPIDGLVIHYGSLPNGYLSPYNLGGTASHELGHWFGLYHTFQDGCDTGACDRTGDRVCDTPAEGTATSGCPEGKDTCPAPGLDPIHNYMDYSTDICYNNFTPGQDARMDAVITQYRGWVGRVASPAATIRNARDPNGALVEFKAMPNPFNPKTKIEFGLRQAGRTSLRIFDVQGRLVATLVDREMTAGNHSVELDGSRLASGIYMMVLKAPQANDEVRRLSLLK